MEAVAERKAAQDEILFSLKNYCTGLLLPGERKSAEPMAARLAPANVRRMHQSLHHVAADAPWSDAAVLRQVRSAVLAAVQKRRPVVRWIVDDRVSEEREPFGGGCAAVLRASGQAARAKELAAKHDLKL